MNYFDGLNILSALHRPKCKAWVDKVFDDYLVLNYAHEGSLMYSREGEVLREIAGPIAWFAWRGPLFRYGWPKAEGEWDHRFVAFQGPRTVLYRRTGLFPNVSLPGPFPIHRPERFRLDFDALVQAFKMGRRQEPRSIHMLEGLLLQLSEQGGLPHCSTPYFLPMQNVYQQMQESPGMAWDFHREAEKLELSYHHFRRVWTQLFKQSPQRSLIQARVECAARMLMSGSPRVKEIAYEVGFPDPYYFNRCFKKHFGIAPGSYAKEMRL